jgi:excinuclease UvrABC ATPase subunit
VQGFMPSLARPDVDLLEGLTTAIIVDQERMGANSRSTVGTATDANAMLRIVFSRLGVPSAGPAFHYSFNLPAGACPRCEGVGTVTDIDLDQLFDRDKSLAGGAITIPGYTADGWQVRIFTASGFLDPDKPIRDYLHRAARPDPDRVRQGERCQAGAVQRELRGRLPELQRQRRHLHGPGDDGRGGDRVRRV